MSPAADETAKIEHELEILRSRYAIFQRWARITKWYCIGLAVIVPAGVIGYAISFAAGYVVARDPFAAGFVIVATLLVSIGLFLYFYLARDNDYRWIDTVSIPPGWPWGRIFNIGPKSEAAAIETMIADREARLAELKRRPA